MTNNYPNLQGSLLSSFQVPMMYDNFADWRSEKGPLYNAVMYGSEDALNFYNSEMSSFRDVLKWMATNEWNLAQWNRENEYNSPVQQVQRLLEAGINPLWSMSDNKSQAAHLTSPLPSSSSPLPMTTQEEQLDLQRSQFAQANALQSVATMGDLSIKERALRNEIRQTDSAIQKTRAETDLLKSQLETNDFLNKVNSVTFDTQVNLKIEELNSVRQNIRNLEAQENLTDNQVELLKAQKDHEKVLKDYTLALAKKVESETFDKLENLKQRWYSLVTARIQANAAATSSAAAMMNAHTSDAALNHQIQKDEQEMRQKSNEQIIQLIDMQRGFIDRFLGNPSNGLSGLYGNYDFVLVDRAISFINAGYKELCNRFYSNPTKVNAESMSKVQNMIDQFQRQKFDIKNFLPFNTSQTPVYNGDWQSWQ